MTFERRWGLFLLVPALACGQRAAGRATQTTGTLAVMAGAGSMADNACYESTSDDSEVRDRNSFCSGARTGPKPEGAGAVLALGAGAVVAGKAIELNAKEKGRARPSTSLVSGNLPGQELPALPIAPRAQAEPSTSSPAEATPPKPVAACIEAPGPTRERAAGASCERSERSPEAPISPANTPK